MFYPVFANRLSLSLSLKSSSLRALALGGVNTPQLLFYNPREQKLTASGFAFIGCNLTIHVVKKKNNI